MAKLLQTSVFKFGLEIVIGPVQQRKPLMVERAILVVLALMALPFQSLAHWPGLPSGPIDEVRARSVCSLSNRTKLQVFEYTNYPDRLFFVQGRKVLSSYSFSISLVFHRLTNLTSA